MPKPSSQEIPVSNQSERSGYDGVLSLYLIFGAIGLLFRAVLVLADMEWLEIGVITFYVLIGGEFVLSLCGWIPGFFLLVRFRHSWRVAIPAGLLTLASAFYWLLALSGYPLLLTASSFLMALFLTVAFLAGMEWLVQAIGWSGNRRQPR